MLLNGQPTTGGLSHMELCGIAGQWGAPWHADPTAGNGYPILQWQYDRGDYRLLCGFDPDSDPSTGINDISAVRQTAEARIYNLAGQQVKVTKDNAASRNLPKGIYIIDGRKVIK